MPTYPTYYDHRCHQILPWAPERTGACGTLGEPTKIDREAGKGKKMSDQSADEIKKRNIEKMGEPLGAQFSALWQELAILYVYWAEYQDLFGTKLSRIELVNRAAPMFFHMLQKELWDSRLMHLARITDSSETAGKKNLTIRNLPDLISDAALKAEVTKLVGAAVKSTEFCRDWRNRHIGHSDLKLALGEPAAALADASRKQVSDALKAVSDVLNAIELHYFKSQTAYDLTPRHNGAVTLLYALNDGIKVQNERAERAKAGEFRQGDLQTDDV
jgi:hypothetical protein